MLNQSQCVIYEINDAFTETKLVHNYFDLLKQSYERYESLKESGASEATLFIEKGLIDSQLQFLFKCYKKISD